MVKVLIKKLDPAAKIPSYKILDVAEAVKKNCEKVIVGLRPGEKIHEEMITASDSINTVDLGKYFAILPLAGQYSIEDYCAAHGGQPVPLGFAYDSCSNPDFLSIEQLRHMIAKYVTDSKENSA